MRSSASLHVNGDFPPYVECVSAQSGRYTAGKRGEEIIEDIVKCWFSKKAPEEERGKEWWRKKKAVNHTHRDRDTRRRRIPQDAQDTAINKCSGCSSRPLVPSSRLLSEKRKEKKKSSLPKNDLFGLLKSTLNYKNRLKTFKKNVQSMNQNSSSGEPFDFFPPPAFKMKQTSFDVKILYEGLSFYCSEHLKFKSREHICCCV